MRRIITLMLALILLTACAAPAQTGGGSTQQAAAGGQEQPPEDPAEPEEPEEPEKPEPPAPEPYEISNPADPKEGYVPWDGIVEHLFFHPVVAYPELAFDGDAQANGIDDYMVTVGEYNKILQSVYEKGYVLVDIADVWSATPSTSPRAKSP